MKTIKQISISLFVLLALMLSSCGGNGPTYKKGDKVTVSEKCIVAVDEDSFSEMIGYCNRRDERGLELMEMRGEIMIVYGGTKGTVVDVDFGKIKIRLDNDREYWCAKEFIK